MVIYNKIQSSSDLNSKMANMQFEPLRLRMDVHAAQDCIATNVATHHNTSQQATAALGDTASQHITAG
jgi:hypothetical protein